MATALRSLGVLILLAGAPLLAAEPAAPTPACASTPVKVGPTRYQVTFGPGSNCWIVPDGVAAATFTVAGGSGAPVGSVAGGKGAAITVHLTTDPGATIAVLVGAAGEHPASGNGTGGRGGDTRCLVPCGGLPGGRGGDGTYVTDGLTLLVAEGGGGGAGAPGHGADGTCATSPSAGAHGLNGGNPKGWVPASGLRYGAPGANGFWGYCDSAAKVQTAGGGGGGGGYVGGNGGGPAGWVGPPVAPSANGARGGGGGTNYLLSSRVAAGTSIIDYGGVRTGDGFVRIAYDVPG